MLFIASQSYDTYRLWASLSHNTYCELHHLEVLKHNRMVLSTARVTGIHPVRKKFPWNFKGLASYVPVSPLFSLSITYLPCFTGERRAAGFVGNASPSTLLDNTTGRIAKAARDLAATVVALVRSAGGRDLRQPQRCSSARRQGEANAWQTFDSGILVVQARLTRDAVDSQVFQEQLLLALRHENSTDDEEQGPGVGERGKSTTAAVPLALYWRLHESGLLPFSRLLEAREAFSPPLTLGQRRGGGAQRFCNDAGEGYMDVIIHGIRALAMQSAREAGDAGSPPGDAASLVSDIAKHLFDLAYRKLPNGSRGLATGRDTTEALSSSAARIVLDQLCCGPEVYG